jgi:hypothetical protein
VGYQKAANPVPAVAGDEVRISSATGTPQESSRLKFQKTQARRPGLPPNWDQMSVGGLWDALNAPQRNATPQSVVEAIMYSVGERGLAALEEPNNQERLSRCDDAAREQIKRRIAKLREQAVLP